MPDFKWKNPKQAHTQYAVKLAKEKHPKGFNKEQLLECGKEVFGGFAGQSYKEIKTEKDIEHQRNNMALIEGDYPLSMTDCEVVGINGDCGYSCPVFLNGDCQELGDMTRDDYQLDCDMRGVEFEEDVADSYWGDTDE